MRNHLPQWTHPYLERAVAMALAEPGAVGLMLGGSAVTGTMDEYSDLDLVLVCREEHQAGLLRRAPDLAARLGPLLACFTGEHVGEPRLLISLLGPPPVHVDLKIITDRELDRRVEDAVVLWQRDGLLDAALQRTAAAWPSPDPQWIEDRFWVWVHYGAAKIGRGELFECLDVLASLRSMVFGPLLAARGGSRPQGVRRLERVAPGTVPALEKTVGDHTAPGCVAALLASVDLYRQLRADLPGLVHRAAAEEAGVAYLEDVGSRIAAEASAGQVRG